MQLPTLQELNREIARQSFWEYRRIIRPKMIPSQWQKDLCTHLQQFYCDMKAGKRPKLGIIAPPQHGKSETVTDFVSWVAGMDATIPTMYASYSDMLGIRANTHTQLTIDGSRYQELFDTRINSANVVTTTNPRRNQAVIDYIDTSGNLTGGGFRNTTVLGACTGEGLGLGLIDDAVKGRKEARSPTVRQNTWMWFLDDFWTRFSDDAGLICMMTRWHLDDLLGRMIEAFPTMKVLHYPAINEEGEALFPELKSLEFLQERKSVMIASSWESLYQGDPIPEAGTTLHHDRIKIAEYAPKMIKVVRYWDTAGTEKAGCYTAGVKLGTDEEGNTWLLDVVWGQWARAQRERIIRQTCELDGRDIKTYIERQGGSSGKEVVQDSIRNLAGFSVYEDLPTGDKVLRAQPVGAQMENGNFYMLKASWNKAYLDEAAVFPDGNKDQIDATSGAFAKLTGGSEYFFR